MIRQNICYLQIYYQIIDKWFFVMIKDYIDLRKKSLSKIMTKAYSII